MILSRSCSLCQAFFSLLADTGPARRKARVSGRPRTVLTDQGAASCIPPGRNRNQPVCMSLEFGAAVGAEQMVHSRDEATLATIPAAGHGQIGMVG